MVRFMVFGGGEPPLSWLQAVDRCHFLLDGGWESARRARPAYLLLTVTRQTTSRQVVSVLTSDGRLEIVVATTFSLLSLRVTSNVSLNSFWIKNTRKNERHQRRSARVRPRRPGRVDFVAIVSVHIRWKFTRFGWFGAGQERRVAFARSASFRNINWPSDFNARPQICFGQTLSVLSWYFYETVARPAPFFTIVQQSGRSVGWRTQKAKEEK